MAFWKHMLAALGLLAVMGVAPVLVRGQADAPVASVRVMNFNVWVGGYLVDFAKVVESIEAAEADVVLLQEAGGNARAIAELLGWPYVSDRMQTISRLPLIDPAGADGNYIYVQTAPGRVFAVATVHLPSDPYGPYLVRDGATLEDVLQNEADTRMPPLEAHLAALQPLIDAGVPLVLAGDFNTPSHLDWTEATMAMRPEMKYLVEWPVTVAVQAAGLIDAYRAVHPDPAARPGHTWTYGYPYPRLREGEVIDRIDLQFATPNITVSNSQIVGPAGSPDVDVPIANFPSDHRAVVSQLLVPAVEPPLFTSLHQRVVRVGEPVIVRYHVPAGEAAGDLIGIVAADAPVSDDSLIMWLPPMEADFFGAVTFSSWTLTPGAYDAVAASAELSEYARARFWVVPRDAAPTVSVDRASYRPGADITVTWANLPDNRWDWIGVYAAGDANLGNYLAFVYTQSQSSGSVTLTVDDLGELAQGDYVVRVFEDDWYGLLAETPFSVGE